MAAVQDAHLSLLIRMHVVCPYDVIACLPEGKLILVMAADYPQMKDFCCIDQLVLVADFLCQFLYLISGISGHDAVYQSAAEIIFFFNPVLKSVLQLPEIRVLEYTFFQIFSIIVNEFTGKKNQAL